MTRNPPFDRHKSMGNGTMIPKLGERVRESKSYNSRYFFPGSDDIRVDIRITPKKRLQKYRNVQKTKNAKIS
jgi:hypothetical protein